MNNYPAILLICASLPLWAFSLRAQEKAPTADEVHIVPQWKKDFEAIGPAKQKSYHKHMLEAGRLFGQKRIIETLNEIAEGQRVFPDDPNALNLIGACYVEFRAFDKARSAFESALEKQGAYLDNLEGVRGDALKRRMKPVLNILFNLAEIDFVTKEWKSCQKRIEALLPLMDSKNPTLLRLIEFKYLLCKVKLGQIDEARGLASKYDYLDDYPYYYYANAALAYHDEKLEEAERWRGSARRVFRSTATLAPWEDTMIESGFVKSFYGGTDDNTE